LGGSKECEWDGTIWGECHCEDFGRWYVAI